jgi:hypothetical protein
VCTCGNDFCRFTSCCANFWIAFVFFSILNLFGEDKVFLISKFAFVWWLLV